MDYLELVNLVDQGNDNEYKTVYSSKSKPSIPDTEGNLDIIPPTQSKYASVSHKDFIAWMRFYMLCSQNLHWAALNHSTHVVLGDVYKYLNNFIDDIAEKLQGIYMPFCIADVPLNINKAPIENAEFLYKEVINLCIEFKQSITSDPLCIGVMSDLDNCVAQMNKFNYLTKLSIKDSI